MAIDYDDFMSREAKWAEIDLDALAYNMRNIREKTGPDRRICAVTRRNRLRQDIAGERCGSVRGGCHE